MPCWRMLQNLWLFLPFGVLSALSFSLCGHVVLVDKRAVGPRVAEEDFLV